MPDNGDLQSPSSCAFRERPDSRGRPRLHYVAAEFPGRRAQLGLSAFVAHKSLMGGGTGQSRRSSARFTLRSVRHGPENRYLASRHR
jgi:hypothetical protein